MNINRLLNSVLSICLAAAIVSAPAPMLADTVLTASAYEEDASYIDGIFTYKVTEGSVYILGCDTGVTEAVIPDTIERLPVTHVMERTFRNCDELTSVTLPASLQYLGDDMFYDCPDLREVIVPPSVTCLARSSFEGSPWWKAQLKKNEYIIVNGILLAASDKSNGERIVPEGVTKIGDYAFFSDIGLTAVQLPSTLKEIGMGAFFNAGLTEITLPEGLTSIGDDAFQYCGHLTDVTFPSTLTTLGGNVFLETPWLAAKEQESPFVVEHGFLISCTASGDVVIPDGVTAILSGALFWGEMTSLTFPDSVTYLGDSCCSGCRNLESVTFLGNLTAIPSNCFAGCKALTSISIPDSVTEIGGGAFRGCSELTTMQLPSSLKTLGLGCFESCTSLKKIDLPDKLEVMNRTFYNCTALTEITVPGSVRQMNHAFTECINLSSVTICDGVQDMAGAFAGCTLLTSIHIPASVTDMTDALTGCTALESVTVDPDNPAYQSVDNVLFSKDGTKLLLYPPERKGTVHIPASVTDLDGAFADCGALEAITVDPDNPVYRSVDNVLFSKDGTKLLLYPPEKKDTEYVIPDTVTEIADDAFANSKYLTFVKLPEHLTAFSCGSFRNCRSLKELTIPDGITKLSNALSGCDSLETLTLPKSLTTIAEGTVSCKKLKDICYAGSVQDWGMINVCKGNDALYQATVHFGAEDTAEHQKTKLYTANPSSIVSAEKTSYQIESTSGNATFTVIAGNSAEVSKTGLVKPTKNYGETIIQIMDGDTVSFSPCDH